MSPRARRLGVQFSRRVAARLRRISSMRARPFKALGVRYTGRTTIALLLPLKFSSYGWIVFFLGDCLTNPLLSISRSMCITLLRSLYSPFSATSEMPSKPCTRTASMNRSSSFVRTDSRRSIAFLPGENRSTLSPRSVFRRIRLYRNSSLCMTGNSSAAKAFVSSARRFRSAALISSGVERGAFFNLRGSCIRTRSSMMDIASACVGAPTGSISSAVAT